MERDALAQHLKTAEISNRVVIELAQRLSDLENECKALRARITYLRINDLVKL